MMAGETFALALAALLPPAQAPPHAPEVDEIVATAGSRRCDVRFADRTLTDREFERRAAEWAAGRPVRVVAPAGMGDKCMRRIAFRLARRGVRLIEFVDPAEPVTERSRAAPATPR